MRESHARCVRLGRCAAAGRIARHYNSSVQRSVQSQVFRLAPRNIPVTKSGSANTQAVTPAVVLVHLQRASGQMILRPHRGGIFRMGTKVCRYSWFPAGLSIWNAKI